jgi:drug/metabolite transporter (DMT)-like permease
MRLVALAFVLVTLYGLPEAKNWHNYFWAAWSVLLFSLLAIAPRGLYDGRFERWSRRHEVLSGALVTVFMFVPGFMLLTDHFSDRTSLLIAGLIAPGVAALSVYGGRRRRRGNMDEGSWFAVDDESSSR